MIESFAKMPANLPVNFMIELPRNC